MRRRSRVNSGASRARPVAGRSGRGEGTLPTSQVRGFQ